MWLRIVFISLIILLNDYSNFKLVIASIVATAGIMILLPPADLNLFLLELLYYFTLSLFIQYKVETKQQIRKMTQEQQANFAKARYIHQNSLPEELPARKDLAIAAFYEPAEELGGDYYNIFKVDHGAMDVFFEQYFFYMFDVSGHGLDSALLANFINHTIENYFKMKHTQGEEVSPKQILEYIDQQYRAENYPDDYMICILAGVFNLKNYNFTYSSAGFQFPFYKVTNKGTAEEINTGGLPISSSVDKSLIELYNTTIDFKKDEMLFFNTDGLLEQTNISGNYTNQLQDKLTTTDYFHPAAVVQDIKEDFVNFNDSQSETDDITFLTIARLAGDLKEWKIKRKDHNFKQQQKEIIKHLTTSTVEEHQISSAFYKLSTLIWPSTTELKVIILTTSDYLMISLSGHKTKDNWQQLSSTQLETTDLKNNSKTFFCRQHGSKIYLFTSLD